MDLTEFLLARIADDEERAENAIGDRPPGASMTGAFAGEYGPVRVLAECAAKRRIVEGLVPERDPYHDHPDYDAEWVLKDLASVYADHPDYDQDWRPVTLGQAAAQK